MPTEPPSPGGGARERERLFVAVTLAAGASLVICFATKQLQVLSLPLLRREAGLGTGPQGGSRGAQTRKQPRLDPQPQSPPRPAVWGGGGRGPPSEQPAQLPTGNFLMFPVTWIFIM